MPDSDREDNASEERGPKRFRSVREYREMKRLQKNAGSNSDRSVSPEPESKPDQPRDQKDDFIKLLKDTVAHLCYGRLFNSDDSQDDLEVPEWRRVSRVISQTLLEKESRMPPDVRYKVSPTPAREATIKRVQGYTIAYLDRKYPK